MGRVILQLFRSAAFATALSVAAGCGSSASLTDTTARKVIDDYWVTLAPRVLLGDVLFVREGEDHSRGRVSEDHWWIYKDVLGKSEVLSITGERDLTGSFTDWNDWFALTQSGVRRTAKVSLSQAGRSLAARRQVGAFEEIAIPIFRYQTERIVSNDPVPSAVDSYRLVQAEFTFGMEPDLEPALRAVFPNGLEPQRRLRALMKLDAFEKKWAVIAADHLTKGPDGYIADGDRVGAALQQIGR